MPLRYEFIGNLIKILKCIILLCPNQTIFTLFEMKCKQMRLSINQTNIDVNCNEHKQNQPANQPTNRPTSIYKMYRILWKMIGSSPINANFFFDWHNRCHRAFFFVNLSFKIYGYSQSTKWRHCVRTNCTTRTFFPWKCHSTSQFARFFLQIFRY